jgi:hypothetical protein
MNKLYKVEFTGVFCFENDFVGLEKDEAQRHLDELTSDLNTSVLEASVDEVTQISDIADLPYGWENLVPLGSDRSCAEFFDCRDEACEITKRLEEVGYKLKNGFAEDLQRILAEI